MRFSIRDALPADSDQLIELTSLTPMEGLIGLRIDRKPDFFRLLEVNESYILLVAENETKEIKGCFAATKTRLQITGRLQIVYYLRDLKVHPDYKGSKLAYLLVKKMYERLLEEGADILCCTMASGNDAVMPFFQGRAGIPAFMEIAGFNIYQVLPKRNRKIQTDYEIHDTKQFADFFNSCFKQFNISPSCIQPVDLNNCTCFSITNEKHIAAAIAAFDPYDYRQNIVTHYSLSIGLLLSTLRFLRFFFRLPSIPQKNVPLQILYAKFYAFEPGKEQSLKTLFRQLRHHAFKENYHLVAIAADEKDKLMNTLLKPLSRFVFKSRLLATSLQKNEVLLNRMKDGITYEDYSLI